MGREGFGTLGVIYASIELSGVFAGSGLGFVSTKYVAEFRGKDPDDAPAIQRAIASLYSDFERGTLRSRAPQEGFARQFEPQVVAGRFLEAVGRVLRAAPPKVQMRERATSQGQEQLK